MFTALLGLALSNLLYFALHVTNSGSFPKPLSAAKEKEYLQRLESGDESVRSELIEHNLRLVAHIVKKYHSAPCEQDDLISIGTIGLIKGVSTFNSAKGTRLATYAAKCIENEILMYFRNLKKSSQDIYISDPIDMDKEGNTLTLMDIISEENDIINDIDQKIKTEKLYDYIDEVLNDREKQIIIQRYGLNGCDELTQNEIAKKINISRSYVYSTLLL